MILYFIKSIIRSIINDKTSAIINFLNMVVGFTAFILLGKIVYNELNWDRYQANYDRIYRVQTRQDDSEAINYCAYSPSAIRYNILDNIPEVEQALIMRELNGQFFNSVNGKQVYDSKGYFAENNIFNIFTYHFLQGSKKDALKDPNTIVLSEDLAGKLFPGEDALGKEVLIGKRFYLRVDGVYRDLPFNSAIRPSYLVSIRTYEIVSGRTDFRENWTAIDNDNFVLLKPGADYRDVNDKIKNTYSQVRNMEKSTPYLHPLSSLHTFPNNQPYLIIILSILGVTALLILILSGVNYINLSIATSTSRAPGIGIKKVVGFSKRSIALHFLTETIIISITSAIIGLIAAELLIPLMNNMLSTHIETGIFDNLTIIVFVIAVALLSGFLAGIYPALILASCNPIKVIKGTMFGNLRGRLKLRKVLIIAQYSISLFMLIVSLVVYKHVNFMSKKDMGFNKDEIIYADVNVSDAILFESLKERLLQHPEIADAAFSSTIPFNGNIGGYVSWEGGMPEQFEMVSRNYINYDFIPTYNMQIVEGRNFSREFKSDVEGCIINETALKAFGWDEAIGKQIDLWGEKFRVIGVVKDFHAFSVHNPIPGYIMFLNPEVLKGQAIVSVRFTPGNEKVAQQLVSKEFETLLPNVPFEFRSFEFNIQSDNAFILYSILKRIFVFFAVITIIIASIGLFGMIMFTTKRRTKEIGVRKILGSSVTLIFRQLTGEMLGLLVFAIFIAGPAAVIFYRSLPGAYKAKLQIWDFAYPFLFVGIIAFLTISYHILKVARNNPSEALRYE
jgi:putative ABC transport system permease protein